MNTSLEGSTTTRILARILPEILPDYCRILASPSLILLN